MEFGITGVRAIVGVISCVWVNELFFFSLLQGKRAAEREEEEEAGAVPGAEGLWGTCPNNPSSIPVSVRWQRLQIRAFLQRSHKRAVSVGKDIVNTRRPSSSHFMLLSFRFQTFVNNIVVINMPRSLINQA